jgi:selenocysteine lyase/cysteine desulfurase
LEEARKSLAKLIGSNEDEFAFVRDASEGLLYNLISSIEGVKV